MSRLTIKEFGLEDFQIGDDPIVTTVWHLEHSVIPQLNMYRGLYDRDNDWCWIDEIKRVLPRSYKWRDIFGED